MHDREKYIRWARKVPLFLRKLVPDSIYVSLMFFAVYGRLPDLKNPVIFDEKLQWYKLKYRNPLMTVMTDKAAARDYVSGLGYGHILNEVYFIRDRLTEEDFKGLPEQYVIKATHGSAMNIICSGKEQINKEEAIEIMDKWLGINRFYLTREWSYLNIKPRVICERYLENRELGELVDYKYYCYGGEPKVMFVCSGRYSTKGVRYNAYDMDWNRIYVTKGKSGLDFEFKKPDNFDEMTAIARDLCLGFPFVRVDLYSVEGKIYFSEFTFYPDSGMVPFSPDEYNKFFGDFFFTEEYKEEQSM